MSSVPEPEASGLRALFEAYLEVKEGIEGNLEALADTLGICSGQMLVLLDVLAHPGTGLNALCGRTGLKKSAASRQVEALAARGFLERGGVDSDRRAVALHIAATLSGSLCSESSMRAIFPGFADQPSEAADLEMTIAALRRLGGFTYQKRAQGSSTL